MDEAANHQGKHTSSLDKCVDSMLTMLDCVDHKSAEACSISLVPEKLRKWKVEAYMPQVVSIGPLHKGTRTDLVSMEEIKWRYMKHLFSQSQKDQEICLRICIKAMLVIDEIVRASYNVDDVKFNFNPNDLAKIMVLDGCFLLELLINRGEIIEREKVLSDLMLLENQIPVVVLKILSHLLFPIVDKNEIIGLIHKHALSVLGYNYSTLGSSCSELKAVHFLELVHSFIDIERDVTEQNANTVENLKVEVEDKEVNKNERVADRRLKLERCATRLEAAGIKIKPPEASNMAPETRFDLKVTFNKGELEIPRLHITETTEAKWRNLIAWELKEKLRGKRTNQGEINCQFICYAWFFQSLACCIHDVKLLQERNVIFVHEVTSDEGQKKIMSNEDLLNLFRKITEGVPDAEIHMDSRFHKVIDELNLYPTKNSVTETGKIFWHVFICFLTLICYKSRGAYEVLRRVYIPSGWKLIAVLAAAAGLGLTIAQTVFSALDR